MAEDKQKGHPVDGILCCASSCEVEIIDVPHPIGKIRSCKGDDECSKLQIKPDSPTGDPKNCGCRLFRLKRSDIDDKSKSWEPAPEQTTPPTVIDPKDELKPIVAGEDREHFYACFCVKSA